MSFVSVCVTQLKKLSMQGDLCLLLFLVTNDYSKILGSIISSKHLYEWAFEMEDY